MKKTDDILDEMKASARRGGQKCRCCGNEVVKAILARYFQRMDAGEDMPSITHVANVIERDYQISRESVRGHIRRCLKR